LPSLIIYNLPQLINGKNEKKTSAGKRKLCPEAAARW
jgi:hypothetical protein